MNILKKIYKACFFTLFITNVAAQNVDVALPADTGLKARIDNATGKLFIHQINVSGNRRTKDYIILREIQFKAGDSIDIHTINEAFQLARQQVYNTTLFNEVKIELAMISAHDIDVNVAVKER
ncbi:MAG: POTRA domain-containing protein, partial [Ferruginibacter sp.]